MISMNYNIIVKPGKTREFEQVMDCIINDLAKDEECPSCDFKRNDKIKEQYFLYSEWQDIEALKKHFMTELFSLLQGAFAVLCMSQRIEITKETAKVNIDFSDLNNYSWEQIYDKLNAALMELDDSEKVIKTM